MSQIVNLRDFRVGRRYVLPPDVARIDRATKYGNPFRIGDPVPGWTPQDGPWGASMDRDDVIRRFRQHASVIDVSFWEPLRGKHLACHCAPLPCHGDVILELLGKRGPDAAI